MKALCILLVGVFLFVFGVVAQADDPYVGSYSCSGSPMQGCGSCPDFSIEGPKRMVVSYVSGTTYKFCDETGECETGDVQGGVARWTEKDSDEGITISATATATFNNNTLTMAEYGTVSGSCSCDFSVQTLCTK